MEPLPGIASMQVMRLRPSECQTLFLSLLRPDFLDAQASLAPTHVCSSVSKSYFRISILSASLVALREK